MSNKDDCINRRDVIDAMKDMYRAAEKWLRDATDDVTKARAESCMASIIEIKLRTEKLPAVQPEPHEGYWIGGDGSYICSECNSSPMDFIETMGSSFNAYVETLMNFCPNCGARMKGGLNETD